jgi:hypothetical protein
MPVLSVAQQLSVIVVYAEASAGWRGVDLELPIVFGVFEQGLMELSLEGNAGQELEQFASWASRFFEAAGEVKALRHDHPLSVTG